MHIHGQKLTKKQIFVFFGRSAYSWTEANGKPDFCIFPSKYIIRSNEVHIPGQKLTKKPDFCFSHSIAHHRGEANQKAAFLHFSSEVPLMSLRQSYSKGRFLHFSFKVGFYEKKLIKILFLPVSPTAEGKLSPIKFFTSIPVYWYQGFCTFLSQFTSRSRIIVKVE